jgi:hypothetical protein
MQMYPQQTAIVTDQMAMGAVPQQTYVQPTAYAGEFVQEEDTEQSAETQFNILNGVACICALAIFVLLIASLSTSWYYYTREVSVQRTDSQTAPISIFSKQHDNYFLYGTAVKDNGTTGAAEGSEKSEDLSDIGDDINTIFQVCFAFVLIALIVAAILVLFLAACFVTAIRVSALFNLGLTKIRILNLVLGLLILVSLLIAFLTLLGLTSAFENSATECQTVKAEGVVIQAPIGYCSRFSDRYDERHGIQTITDFAGWQDAVAGETDVRAHVKSSTSWGPSAGWYLVLACLPLCVIMIVMNIMAKMPIPSDDGVVGGNIAGAGEAL